MKIENAQVLMSDGVFRRASVEFGETISSIELTNEIDSTVGPYLLPGLIDIHTHGNMGGDHSDGNCAELEMMAKYYASHGITSFLATTLTDTEETLAAAMKTVADYKRSTSAARCLGVNLEGPFFCHEKRGAHQAELLRLPDIAMFERLYELSGENINLVCVAPELDGAMEFIEIVSRVATVSLAHTNADYDTAMKAFDKGAGHVTHLYNAMSAYNHRMPGIVGAAMDAGAYVEVISDGFHLHPSVIRGIYKMFPNRVCMISDSLRCTGLPDGDYESAGLPIKVINGKAMLADESAIAGSTITLMQGLKIAVSLGISLADAAMAATLYPAQSLGIDDKYGVIKPGAAADFVLLDGSLNLQKVYIAGQSL